MLIIPFLIPQTLIVRKIPTPITDPRGLKNRVFIFGGGGKVEVARNSDVVRFTGDEAWFGVDRGVDRAENVVQRDVGGGAELPRGFCAVVAVGYVAADRGGDLGKVGKGEENGGY